MRSRKELKIEIIGGLHDLWICSGRDGDKVEVEVEGRIGDRRSMEGGPEELGAADAGVVLVGAIEGAEEGRRTVLFLGGRTLLANGWWSEAETTRREARLRGLADTDYHSIRTSVEMQETETAPWNP